MMKITHSMEIVVDLNPGEVRGISFGKKWATMSVSLTPYSVRGRTDEYSRQTSFRGSRLVVDRGSRCVIEGLDMLIGGDTLQPLFTSGGIDAEAFSPIGLLEEIMLPVLLPAAEFVLKLRSLNESVYRFEARLLGGAVIA